MKNTILAVVTFIRENWKYLLGLAIVLALIVLGNKEWQAYKNKPVPSSPDNIITFPQQTIHSTTDTIKEITVQPPSTPGAVLQFVERQGKVIAIANNQEVEVPNNTGQPRVEIGKNGELSIATSSTAKLDVTDMVNAQARLIANQELEKQAKINKEASDKAKSSRNRERALWIIGTGGLLYLMHK